MAIDKNITMFIHWNSVTRLCYERQVEQGLTCDGCPNLSFCNTEPWNINPYGIKNMKYAMIQTLKNIGEPK
jgi:hypothetical protein